MLGTNAKRELSDFSLTSYPYKYIFSLINETYQERDDQHLFIDSS